MKLKTHWIKFFWDIISTSQLTAPSNHLTIRPCMPKLDSQAFCWLTQWQAFGAQHAFTTVQGLATYGTCATLGTPGNFQWHAEAPSFTHRLIIFTQKIHWPWKKAYVIGTLNDLKPYVGTQLAKGCHPLHWTVAAGYIPRSWHVTHANIEVLLLSSRAFQRPAVEPTEREAGEQWKQQTAPTQTDTLRGRNSRFEERSTRTRCVFGR